MTDVGIYDLCKHGLQCIVADGLRNNNRFQVIVTRFAFRLPAEL